MKYDVGDIIYFESVGGDFTVAIITDSTDNSYTLDYICLVNKEFSPVFKLSVKNIVFTNLNILGKVPEKILFQINLEM